ncbi:MAG: CBS domain-containing protein [Candidatus Binatia bacterium]
MSNARIQTWMTSTPPTLGPKDSVKSALAVLRTTGSPELVIVDAGVVVGMLNERDIWQHCPTSAVMLEEHQRTELLETFRIGAVMALHPPVLAPDDSLSDAARLFAESGRRGLAVVSDGGLVGFLSEATFLYAAGLLLQEDGESVTKRED